MIDVVIVLMVILKDIIGDILRLTCFAKFHVVKLMLYV